MTPLSRRRGRGTGRELLRKKAELPMAEERDQLTDHEYDGIREYDNPTPGWWHAVFWASVVFAFFYVLFWHGSPLAWTIQDAHAAAELREIKRQFAEIGTLEQDEATML